MTSGKCDLNGWPIWYEKFGSGREIVCLIPGAMGTGRSDFKEQLEGQNAFDLKRYTFIAIEMCGWGRSRPPKRSYDEDMYNRDADCAAKVMEFLGYKTYIVIGWSDGAKVALLMSYLHPIRVKCAVVSAVLVHATKEAIAPMIFTRDLNRWPKEHYNNLHEVYGDDNTLQLIWDQHINFIKDAMNNKYGDRKYIITPEELSKIRCPVLILHGDKDPLVNVDQSLLCRRYIPESVLHRFSEGSHNCHQVLADEFKKVVERFFDNCDNCF